MIFSVEASFDRRVKSDLLAAVDFVELELVVFEDLQTIAVFLNTLHHILSFPLDPPLQKKAFQSRFTLVLQPAVVFNAVTNRNTVQY